MKNNKLRNIAIIAHVDHGKTTLVDELLKQSNTLAQKHQREERIMDSNALEKERGITILAKNTAINWQDHRINIVDTPGHADFGGEVERILSMVDSVLLLVDAVEGPMPQTRFVTQKAFAAGLKPIVVINKVDRDGARSDWVADQVFELFDNLGATDEQLDFPIIYASALKGMASMDLANMGNSITPLLDAIIDLVPAPTVHEGPLQMQISSLDYSSYVGAIAIGRITRGSIKSNQQVAVVKPDGSSRNAKIMQVFGYLGLERTTVEDAQAGDIIAISGIENIKISDTICDPKTIEPLPALTVDEPTISMIFQVNDSPFAGKSKASKFLTSRQIKERLERELIHNVALQVTVLDDPSKFRVAGRGELHLSVLIETMRREGYEFSVSRPTVIYKEENGQVLEPFENVTIDIDEEHQGSVMESLAQRGGELQNLQLDNGRVRIDYIIPARGLIGFHPQFVTLTAGSGLFYHTFDKYAPKKSNIMALRSNGVMIANQTGTATAYALWNLQSRGNLLIGPQTPVYEGMIVGIHSRDNDLDVNVCKAKQLTNMRASGSDENIILTPPKQITLEGSLTFINDDELVEITPDAIRFRKKFLKPHERKRDAKSD